MATLENVNGLNPQQVRARFVPSSLARRRRAPPRPIHVGESPRHSQSARQPPAKPRATSLSAFPRRAHPSRDSRLTLSSDPPPPP